MSTDGHSSHASNAPQAVKAECFIYYRVMKEDLSEVVRRVATAHKELRTVCPRVTAKLMRRDEWAADLVTVMEVYAGLDGLAADTWSSWAECLAQALHPMTVGERHHERFIPCA